MRQPSLPEKSGPVVTSSNNQTVQVHKCFRNKVSHVARTVTTASEDPEQTHQFHVGTKTGHQIANAVSQPITHQKITAFVRVSKSTRSTMRSL